MKTVVYEGPRKVSMNDVPEATIERPTDVLVSITATNICGSDPHMYEGRTDFETGRTFGHENMGEVIEIGNGVDRIKLGDRVVLPFNISCGFCANCERGFTKRSSSSPSSRTSDAGATGSALGAFAHCPGETKQGADFPLRGQAMVPAICNGGCRGTRPPERSLIRPGDLLGRR